VWLGISYTRAFGNTVTQATKENQMVKIVSDEGKASTGQMTILEPSLLLAQQAP